MMNQCDHCDDTIWPIAFSMRYRLCHHHYEIQFESQKRKNKAMSVKALKEKRRFRLTRNE